MSMKSVKVLREAIRAIINEDEGQPNPQQAIKSIKTVMTNAQTFVDNVVAGTRDKAAIQRLKDSVEELRKLSTVLGRNRMTRTWADKVYVVVSAAENLTKKSHFLNVPLFLNVNKHVEEVRELFNALRSAARQAFATILPK